MIAGTPSNLSWYPSRGGAGSGRRVASIARTWGSDPAAIARPWHMRRPAGGEDHDRCRLGGRSGRLLGWRELRTTARRVENPEGARCGLRLLPPARFERVVYSGLEAVGGGPNGGGRGGGGWG